MENQTKRCPYCGEEILAVARKCRFCGEWLDRPAPPPEKPKVPCPICGELIDEGLEECPFCHEPLDTPTDTPSDTPQPAPERTVAATEFPNAATGKTNAATEFPGTASRQSPPQPNTPPPYPNQPDTSGRHDYGQTPQGYQAAPPVPPVAAPYGAGQPPAAQPGVAVDEPPRGFFDYYFVDVFFRHYADFRGTISRRQFWFACLCLWIVMVVPRSLENVLWLDNFLLQKIQPFTLAIGLGLLVPSLAAAVRRLRDAGKNPWLILVGLIPIAGLIWLIVLYCQPGKAVARRARVKAPDIIIFVVAFLIWVVCAGIVLSHKPSEKDVEKLLDLYGLNESTSPAWDSASVVNPVQRGDTYVGSSESGRYTYYLDHADASDGSPTLRQVDSNDGMTYHFDLTSLGDGLPFVASVSDYTTVGNYIILITYNGGNGMFAGGDALAFEMDQETWTHIGGGSMVEFKDGKTKLSVTQRDGDKQTYDLTQLP